jgi:hypothetical protein
VNGDTKDEANETFTVTLSSPVNATLSDGQGTGTITDDDGVPGLSIDDVSVTEGDSGTTTASFTVSLSAASGQTVTVSYATADGTATTADGDYAAGSGPLTFAPGTTTQSVNVTVNGDTKSEADETFTVTLSSPVNATISDGQGTGTITNDDAGITLPDALDVTVPVQTSGVQPWFGQSDVSHDGVDAAQSGDIENGQDSVLSLSLTGPGTVRFWWKVSSEAYFDYLTVSVDGMETDGIAGDVDWTEKMLELTDGPHEIRWTYVKDGSASSGMDAGWVDSVRFSPPGVAFYTVSPCRVLDSRETAGPWGGQPVAAGEERTLTVTGACEIPATATALSYNITATSATANGHLRVYPAGVARPGASTVNFTAGLTRANNGIVPLGAAGDVAIYSGQATGSVHVIVDVNGYFE